MRQLSKVENIIFLVGAVLMVVGSVANILRQSWAPWLFAMGVVMFVLMQFKQGYDGNNITIRRLRTIIIFSDIAFLLSAVLMFANGNNFLGLSHFDYIRYIHNNWVVALLIGAVLQLYASFRLGSELAKEETKEDVRE